MPIVAPDTLDDEDSVFPHRRVTYRREWKPESNLKSAKPIACFNHYGPTRKQVN